MSERGVWPPLSGIPDGPVGIVPPGEQPIGMPVVVKVEMAVSYGKGEGPSVAHKASQMPSSGWAVAVACPNDWEERGPPANLSGDRGDGTVA